MHPSDDELRSFSSGRIDTASRERLQTHLEFCEACQRRLDEIEQEPPSDPFLQKLADYGSSSAQDRREENPLPDVSELMPGDAPPAPSPGTGGRCYGRYEIAWELGRGGMGVVYKAHDPLLRRSVAMKVIRPELALSRSYRERFRREARGAASLQHPNIVQIFDWGEDKATGTPFLALELVNGESLSKRLAGEGVSPRQAAEILARLANAVHYAHTRPNRLIHRDLKPANVLLDKDGNPKIADFGLCKVVGQETPESAADQDRVSLPAEYDAGATAAGTVMGSLCYLSPEQARGDTAAIEQPTNDVYGLGAILYEMLTGRPPLEGDDRTQMLHDVQTQMPPSPRELRPGLAPDLDAICMHCLNREPRQRYDTAAELETDLQRFLAGLPVSVRRPPLGERLGKFARRRPVEATLAAILTAAVLAFIVVVSIYNIRLGSLLDESNRRLDQSRRTAYAMLLNRAAILGRHDPHQACLLLDNDSDCPEDLRDFSWRYLHSAFQQTAKRCLAPEDIGSLTVDAGRKWLAAGGEQGAIVVYDLSGKPIAAGRTGQGESARPIDLAFHPREKMVAAACRDGSIRLWKFSDSGDMDVLALPEPLPGGAADCNGVAFSRDGTRLAAAYADGMVRIWDPAKRCCLSQWKGSGESVREVAFSHDGERLAAGSRDGTIRLWSAEGSPLATIDLNESSPQGKGRAEISDVRFRPSDGEVLAAAVYDPGKPGSTVRLWKVTPAPVKESSGVRLEPMAILGGFAREVIGIDFSHDGKLLAATDADWMHRGGAARTLRIWDISKTPPALTSDWSLAAPLAAVRFAPSDDLLVAEGQSVYQWGQEPADQPRPIAKTHDGPVMAVGCLAGRIFSLGDDGTLAVWDAGKRELIGRRPAISLACAAGVSWAAFLADDGKLQTWRSDAKSPTPLGRLEGAECNVLVCLAISWDGSRLAVGGAEGIGNAGMRDFPPGRRQQMVKDVVAGLAFRPCGELLAIDSDRCRVRRVVDGCLRETLLERREDRFNCLAVSPDDASMAVGTEAGEVILWGPGMREAKTAEKGHKGPVRCVAFSPDGKTLASGGADGQVRLWDARNGVQRGELEPQDAGRSPPGVNCLAFFPGSDALAAGCDDGTIWIWRSRP